jgi:hypothetical protein
MNRRIIGVLIGAALATTAAKAEEGNALASLESKVENLKQTTLATEAAPAQDLPYAVVPHEKREQLVARLRIVAQILRKTGRAYDYRTLKTSELERLHDEALQSQKRSGS